MQAKRYLCNQCQELFELLEPNYAEGAKCPRCASRDIGEFVACVIRTGPPPWEYECQQCGGRFRVMVPSGPTEEKKIRCPVCESKNIERSAFTSEVCPPGG